MQRFFHTPTKKKKVAWSVPFFGMRFTHCGGKTIRPISKDPRCQMWFTLIQILHRSYHARGTKNDSHHRWSVLVSSIHLFCSTQRPGKILAMELQEDCGMVIFSRKAMVDNYGGGKDILASTAVDNAAFCITIDLECPSLSLRKSGKSRICLSS
jgi:hypothetical protein